MFKIIQVNNFYVLKLTGIESDEFYQIQLDMKKFRVYYDKKSQGFKIPNLDLVKLLKFKGYQFSNYSDFINDKQELIESESDYFRREVFDESIVKIKPYNYQLEDIQWLIKKSRNFIASDPGTGKTFEAISWFSHLRKNQKIKGILIVVKNILQYHWLREILEYSNMFQENEIGIVDNKNKHTYLENETSYVIIIPNHAPILSTFIESNEQNISKLKDYCLVIDEVHEFANIDSKRTQSLSSIIDLFPYRLFLSATPALNDYTKWFTLMRLLDKGIIQHSSLLGFSLDVGKFIGDKFNPFKVLSYNTDRVQHYNQLLRGWVIKRIKSELPEMKTKQLVKPIWFQLSNKHKAIINLVKELELDKVDLKTLSYSTIQNKFPYMVMALENPELLKTKIKETDRELFYQPLKKLLDSWKLDDHNKILYLDEYLKQKIEIENEKIIVYDTHPVTLNQLSERYSKYNPTMIHGELKLTNESRQQIIDDFNNPKSKTKLLLLNIQSASSGLSLNKGGCKVIIFFTLPFDSILTRQGFDRVFRINSIEDSFVELLTFDKSIDSLRLKKTLKRIELNDTMFKDNDEINLNDLLNI